MSGTSPSTVSESSRRSESGLYGEVTTTSTVVVLARGAEEQVCWDTGAGWGGAGVCWLFTLPLPFHCQHTYTCTATNALGEDEANITVHEGGECMHIHTLNLEP